MARESFIVYKSFYGLFQLLPEDKRLAMYEAIFSYGFDGKLPKFSDEPSKAIWGAILPQLRANNARYENGCKGKEFGVLGGRPRKAQETANETRKVLEKNDEIKTPKKPLTGYEKETPSKTRNENENENENENGNERESAHARVIVSSLSQFFEMDGDFSEQELETLQKLKPIVEKNDYLRSWRFASKYLAKAEKIFAGYYDKYKEERHECKMAHGYEKHEYTEEQLNAIFYNVDGEQNGERKTDKHI